MIVLPESCPRGLDCCQPYNQIVSSDAESFFCCGKNDGTLSEEPGDIYTLCFKGTEADDMACNDKRDLIHLMSVISGAVAVIEEVGQ